MGCLFSVDRTLRDLPSIADGGKAAGNSFLPADCD